MKNSLISLTLFALIALGLALGFHIIRTENGFEIVAKDTITLRDAYVDARHWDFDDYLAHSSRIRNHLLYRKYYLPLKKSIKEEAPKYIEGAKKALRAAEQTIHDWISKSDNSTTNP